ncbi:hypothetical protein BN77_2776 [Rhizobium mesoamericanum STM3625]|uniref:Uncharacterized protein n=1 Tax=Rhizobium mesoamericanum STM3625 TaxID=1211777 RepID=K0PWF6_9HYPH|nr:hypothetical protein BN77_2776 [Rhizobium mesoamericanum STM3625]
MVADCNIRSTHHATVPGSSQAFLKGRGRDTSRGLAVDRGTRGGQGVFYWPDVLTLLTEELRAVSE